MLTPPSGTGSSAPRCECVEAWTLQAEAGPLTVEAFEAILARAAVPIARQLEDLPPDLVHALVPSLVRVMLTSFKCPDSVQTDPADQA